MVGSEGPRTGRRELWAADQTVPYLRAIRKVSQGEGITEHMSLYALSWIQEGFKRISKYAAGSRYWNSYDTKLLGV